MTKTKFILIYAGAWLITYIIQYFKLGIAAQLASEGLRFDIHAIERAQWIYAIIVTVCYVVMSIVTRSWGELTDKKWLISFPIIACIMDGWIGIPFLPSLLCLICFVIVLIDEPKVKPVAAVVRNNNDGYSASSYSKSSPAKIPQNKSEKITSSVNKVSNKSFQGEMGLENDMYKIYLTEKFNVVKNDLFGKFVWNGKMYDDLNEILLLLHDEEQRINLPYVKFDIESEVVLTEQEVWARGIVAKICDKGFYVEASGAFPNITWRIKKDFIQKLSTTSVQDLIDFYIDLDDEATPVIRQLSKHGYSLIGYDLKKSTWILDCNSGKFESNLEDLRSLLKNFE